MVSPRYTAALVLSALLLASCSSSDNGPTTPEAPSDPALPEPHPANVTPVLDHGRTSTARIPVSGGTLQATGADGTLYTLIVPPNALLADTTISMTPLSGVTGLGGDDLNFTVMGFDDFPTDGQAQAQTDIARGDRKSVV